MNIPYMFWRFLTQLSEEWEEYPFSRREYIEYAKLLNPRRMQFVGGSILPNSAYDWLHWFRELIAKRFFPLNMFLSQKLDMHRGKGLDLRRIRKEKGTFLDEYLGYGLILVLKR